MQKKCSDSFLYAFLEYCLAQGKLPPKRDQYAATHDHIESCPRCSDRLSVLFEKHDQYELLFALKNLPVKITNPLSKKEIIFQ